MSSTLVPLPGLETARGGFAATMLRHLFYCAGVVLVGGGFVLYTSMAPDHTLLRDAAAGSPVSQLILASFYSVAALLLFADREGRRIVVAAWPLLLLPGLALLSMLWSPDPALTLRRAIAFTGTVLFGLSLGAAYRFRQTLSIITLSLAAVMLLSAALVVLDPARAVHQPDDAIQAVHAGAWRGIFAHRNTLGFWAGTSLVMLLIFGREVFSSALVWLAMVGITMLCLIATGSSAGISIVALSCTFYLVLVSILRRPTRLRGALGVVWALLAVVAYLLSDTAVRLGLQLLGRDSDLSGRTELWSSILGLVGAADRPLGLGYFVGTLLLDQRLSAATQMRNVNAHNGFLEAYVYFGWLGVVLSAGLVLWLLAGTITLAVRGWAMAGRASVVPVVLVFAAVVHNLVESTIVSPNNLNTVLLAVAGAMSARASLAQGA